MIHLSDAIKRVSDQKKINWSSFRGERIRDIERRYERKEINLDAALEEVKNEFGYLLDRHDFEQIKKIMR